MRRLLALLLGAGLTLLPATVAIAPAQAAEPTCASGAQATVTIEDPTVSLGGTLRISGRGWCHPDGGGSVVGVKIDEGGFSRTDDSVHANKTIWAIVEARGDGTFEAGIELPDGTAQSSTPAFTAGSHTLRLLSGSLKPGDAGRTLQSGSFAVRGDSDPEPPAWAAQTLTGGGATAWVEDAVEPGGALRIRGSGWRKSSGSGGSTVVVKLNSATGQFTRSGTGVIDGDATIWARFTAAADGSFDRSLDLPGGLGRGDFLTVSLFSGKFAAGDVQRTITSTPLAVAGDRGSSAGGGSDVTCVPTTDSPSVSIETPTVSLGGTLTISGAGWCNPAGGGSKIGVKIDEGTINHVDTSLHANTSIWAIVQAGHRDGTFTAHITLPDGTTGTSLPAIGRGAHTLRLLSGSLVAGDTVRSVESGEFVIGSYRPTAAPDPLPAGALTAGSAHGVSATVSGARLTVRVPRGAAGDWIFLSAMAPDGSPRYPWGEQWFRLGAGGTLVTGLGGTPVQGPHRLVLQSGAQGHVGELVGWASVTFPGEASSPDGTGPDGGSDPNGSDHDEGSDPKGGGDDDGSGDEDEQAAPSPGGTLTPDADPATDPATPPGLTDPKPPVRSYDDLDPVDRLDSSLEGTVVTVLLQREVASLVKKAEKPPEGPLFVHVYAEKEILPAGWVRPGAKGKPATRITVDLAKLPVAPYRLTLQDAEGELIGWAEADLTGGVTGTPETDASAPVTTEQIRQIAGWFSATDGWMLGLAAALLTGLGLGLLMRPRGGAR
ncbi:hypothetical protein [Nocardioides insulae]|uniref:hypothetical protein n=1 Tax=Nocardioides insulae TaxID=394734 RepID=UPI0004254D83|nr:hypothetical protein [Nocardioides insulae]